VFFEEWYGLPDAQLDGEAIAAWLKIGAWRAKVNKQLEEARTAGLIGSALAAEVDVYVAGGDYEVLARLGVDLRFVFITSRATVHRVATEANNTSMFAQACTTSANAAGITAPIPARMLSIRRCAALREQPVWQRRGEKICLIAGCG